MKNPKIKRIPIKSKPTKTPGAPSSPPRREKKHGRAVPTSRAASTSLENRERRGRVVGAAWPVGGSVGGGDGEECDRGRGEGGRRRRSDRRDAVAAWRGERGANERER